jgi:hypothetical protein
VELFGDGKIRAALTRSAHHTHARVAKSVQSRSGVSRDIEPCVARSNLVRIVRGADHVGPVAPCSGTGGIACQFDSQGEAGVGRVNDAKLPTAQYAVNAPVPGRPVLAPAPERQLVNRRGDKVELLIEVRRAEFRLLVEKVLPVSGLAARLRSLAIVADGIGHAARIRERHLVGQPHAVALVQGGL